MSERLTPQQRARAGVAAFDLIEAAATGGDVAHSRRVSRDMASVALEELTPGEVAEVVALLATMAVFRIPAPIRDRDVPQRTAAVRAWVPGARLEWTWAAS